MRACDLGKRASHYLGPLLEICVEGESGDFGLCKSPDSIILSPPGKGYAMPH